MQVMFDFSIFLKKLFKVVGPMRAPAYIPSPLPCCSFRQHNINYIELCVLICMQNKYINKISRDIDQILVFMLKFVAFLYLMTAPN